MDNVTKRDLVDRIAAKTGQKRSVVQNIAQEVLNAITEELVAGHRIELRDFGVFEPVYRPGKTAQNPKTLQPIVVSPKYSVRFKPGRRMKDEVTGGKWARDQLRLTERLREREQQLKLQQQERKQGGDQERDLESINQTDGAANEDHRADGAPVVHAVHPSVPARTE